MSQSKCVGCVHLEENRKILEGRKESFVPRNFCLRKRLLDTQVIGRCEAYQTLQEVKLVPIYRDSHAIGKFEIRYDEKNYRYMMRFTNEDGFLVFEADMCDLFGLPYVEYFYDYYHKRVKPDAK